MRAFYLLCLVSLMSPLSLFAHPLEFHETPVLEPNPIRPAVEESSSLAVTIALALLLLGLAIAAYLFTSRQNRKLEELETSETLSQANQSGSGQGPDSKAEGS